MSADLALAKKVAAMFPMPRWKYGAWDRDARKIDCSKFLEMVVAARLDVIDKDTRVGNTLGKDFRKEINISQGEMAGHDALFDAVVAGHPWTHGVVYACWQRGLVEYVPAQHVAPGMLFQGWWLRNGKVSGHQGVVYDVERTMLRGGKEQIKIALLGSHKSMGGVCFTPVKYVVETGVARRIYLARWK